MVINGKMIGNEHSAARNSEFTRNLMEAPKPGTNFPKLAWARGISPWINGRLFLKGKTTTPHLCTSVYVYVYIYIHIYIYSYMILDYTTYYFIIYWIIDDTIFQWKPLIKGSFWGTPHFIRSPNWISHNSSPFKNRWQRARWSYKDYPRALKKRFSWNFCSKRVSMEAAYTTCTPWPWKKSNILFRWPKKCWFAKPNMKIRGQIG